MSEILKLTELKNNAATLFINADEFIAKVDKRIEEIKQGNQ